VSTLSLALITIVVVVAILIATRPAPRQTRRTERTTGAEKNAPDPLSARPGAGSFDLTPAMTLEALHRNRWDRRDLAVGVGRDDQASEPALLLWPKHRRCWIAA
jgi:hypothetical protein